MARHKINQQRWRLLQRNIGKLYKTYNLGVFDWDKAPPGVSFTHFTLQIEDQMQIDRFAFEWHLVFDCFNGKLISATIDGARVENLKELTSGNVDAGVDASRLLSLTEGALESLECMIDQELMSRQLSSTG